MEDRQDTRSIPTMYLLEQTNIVKGLIAACYDVLSRKVPNLLDA